MSILSGKLGVVNGTSTVRDWMVNLLANNQAYVASNTKGGTGRLTGVKDWNGSYNQYAGLPPVMPGSTFTFAGYTGEASYTGPAIVDRIGINWSWGEGSIISTETNFSANGVITTGTTPSTDVSVPQVISSIIAGIKMGLETTGPTTIPNVKSASLEITAANKPYVNSSTSGYTYRRPGNIDWSASLVIQDTNLANWPVVGDFVRLQPYTDLTNFWDLQWGMIGEYTNIKEDIETGEITEFTMNMAMCGYNVGTSTIGAIVMPGGTAFWP